MNERSFYAKFEYVILVLIPGITLHIKIINWNELKSVPNRGMCAGISSPGYHQMAVFGNDISFAGCPL